MGKRKYPKYETKMFYKGYTVGEGTRADGKAYSALMSRCDGNPYTVLRDYKYFSPELRAALEKACRIYDKLHKK